MKKEVSFSSAGQRADIGDMIIYRIIPNRYAQAVGPFVFLDHIAPKLHTPEAPRMKTGTGAHPHRGIATLTYLLHGEDEHFDSAGNYAKVNSGGIQWMMAGNGVIHDETLNVDPQANTRLTHGLQFWINLPPKQKAESPEYLAIQAPNVPQKKLDEQGSFIKVITGRYEALASAIPSYTGQFVYHIYLQPGQQFVLDTQASWEYGAFLPENEVEINSNRYKAGEFIEFDRAAGEIEIKNTTLSGLDLILFGGEPYTDPIVAEGPFVMNSKLQIAEAYRDYFNGKYGTITYRNEA